MTSVSIISAVAARINQLYLRDESKHPDNWRDEADSLLSGLECINRLLKDADQQIRLEAGDKFVKLENQIVQQSYDIDDALAARDLGFPLKREGKKILCIPLGTSGRSSKQGNLESLRVSLEDISKGLQECFEFVKASEQTEMSLPAQMSSPASPTSTTAGEDLENQVRVALLKPNLPVICIWGESGMGKTTLAKKVFYHAEVRRNFDLFAWVSSNHVDFKKKNVLQAILLQMLPNEKVEIMCRVEIELGLHILEVLKKNRCLVVLDDVEDVEDSQNIVTALTIHSSISSKILITTPSKELVKAADLSTDGMYEMKSLTQEQCLNMLKEKANFDDEELEIVGKTIFSLSGGSPLITIILGRALKTPPDAAARIQLLHQLNYLSRTQIIRGTTQVLGLSYDRLSHELKPCLLYMGQFPNGRNIEADKLYLLLAAEDLILREDSEKEKTSHMESLRKMLENLAYKRLVEAQEDKVSMTRMYKSCRLHAKTRSFCIIKGEDEDFFEIVDFKDRKKVRTSTRRLAVYLGKYEDGHVIQFMSRDTVRKIRSLLIFGTSDSKEKSWPEEITDLKEFSHLRVLDFDGVNFNVRKPPKGMDKLVLLRYLSFRECLLQTLPSAISKFPGLETLDLRVKAECKMTIPNVLSHLKRLRHLYFPVAYECDGNGKLQLQGLQMVEILVNFDTGVCDIDDLSHFHNLQILTTISEGKHDEIAGIIKYLDAKKANNLQQSCLEIRNFECYSSNRTDIFRKLLACKYIHSLHIEGQIGDSLKEVEISPNFTEMVFDGSELDDNPMNILGKLADLRSLTLCNDAFIGREVTISTWSKFPELRILKLVNLQYLQNVTFEEGTMPKLSTLEINKCEGLEKVVVSKALDNRLRLAQGKKRDDVYLVEPPPTVT